MAVDFSNDMLDCRLFFWFLMVMIRDFTLICGLSFVSWHMHV